MTYLTLLAVMLPNYVGNPDMLPHILPNYVGNQEEFQTAYETYFLFQQRFSLVTFVPWRPIETLRPVETKAVVKAFEVKVVEAMVVEAKVLPDQEPLMIPTIRAKEEEGIVPPKAVKKTTVKRVKRKQKRIQQAAPANREDNLWQREGAGSPVGPAGVIPGGFGWDARAQPQ